MKLQKLILLLGTKTFMAANLGWNVVRVLAAELATRIDIDWSKKDFRNENHHY
ncbi:hypothetical protein [Pediococcus parvulus]|uniref:hypothetical protein n=1 Tax=Pediococcus parvulus TaxID=54062 RepID=UPI000A63BC0E